MLKITEATDNPVSAAAKIITCAPVSANCRPHQRSINPASTPGRFLLRTTSGISSKWRNPSCPAVLWRNAVSGWACVGRFDLLAGVCRQHDALHALRKTLGQIQNDMQTLRCSSKSASGLHGNGSQGVRQAGVVVQIIRYPSTTREEQPFLPLPSSPVPRPVLMTLASRTSGFVVWYTR